MAKITQKHIRKVIIGTVFILLLLGNGCAKPPIIVILTTPASTLSVVNQNQPTSTVLSTETTTSSPESSLPPQTNQEAQITSIHMVGELQGWAISQALVMCTEDGGKTWLDITPKEIQTFFSSLSSQDQKTFELKGAFVNMQEAWLAVPGMDQITLFRTENRGRSWQTSDISINQTQATFPVQIISLVVVNPQTGWLLLAMGKSAGQENVELYQTKDNGMTWNFVADTGQNASAGKITSDGTKTGLGFSDTSEGWLTGSTHYNKVFLYHTMDGGTTWDTQSIELPDDFTATGGSATSYPPIFFDDQRGVMPVYLGSSTPGINLFFYLTTDGGTHWKATNPVVSQTNQFVWSWVDATHGFVAENGTDTLYSTADAGQSWTKGNSGDLQLSRIDFISPSIGWAISNGSVYQTLDGGKQWVQANP